MNMKKVEHSTVLEKCGISIEIMKFFKKKGLIIPKEIKPFEKHFKSPSEKWFYSIADRFTPPLSEAEMKVYKAVPHLLSLKISKSVELLSDISILLQDALEKVNELKGDKEKVAAILSILKIFHGCLDYNYLKHDRHLEYHDYEESPVGYYWQRFRNFIEKTAERSKVANPKEWTNQKILEIISGPRRMRLSSEYLICCNKVYTELKVKIPEIESLSPEEVKERIERDFPDFFKVIEKYAEEFYRPFEGFITDCVASKDMNPSETMARSKSISKRALEEVSSKLSVNEANELERVVEILEDFTSAQEFEATIFYGFHPLAKTSVLDILIKGYDRLQKLLLSHPEMIKPLYKEEVFALLKAEDVPSKFTALRKFMVDAKLILSKDVEKLYVEAIETWRKL